MAMKQSLLESEILCKLVKDRVKPSSNQQACDNQTVVPIGVCPQTSDFADFE
jgi:hypothetical protein